MDVAKASERLLKLAVSIIRFPRKQGTGVPCRPEVLNQCWLIEPALNLPILRNQSIVLITLSTNIYLSRFPNHFSRFSNCGNDRTYPQTIPFLVSSCSFLSRILPRHGRRERNIIAPVFSSQPRDPTQNRSSSEELLSPGPIFANSAFPSFPSLPFPSLARRGEAFDLPSHKCVA